MVCPHCGSTDWHELEDGRSRCLACFATYAAEPSTAGPPAGASGEARAVSSQGVGKVDVDVPFQRAQERGEGRRRFRA